MPATAEKSESLGHSLNLQYVETLLVKFFVTSRDEVPHGITETIRVGQKELDAQHIEQAKAERIAKRRLERDRIRPGHLDTGYPVYQNEAGVCLPTLVEGLIREGYGLRDVHFFQQNAGRRLWVVTFALEFGSPSSENVAEIQKHFAKFAANSWTVNVWDNPTLTATINCTKRLRERAQRKLVAGTKRIRIV